MKIGAIVSAVFRSYSAIIIIIILIGLYLSYSVKWENDLSKVARQKTLSDINSALALTLYKVAVEGNLSKLSRLDRDNPFIYLSIYQTVPDSYQGVISHRLSATERGWYYDKKLRMVYYVDKQREIEKFAMVLEYTDNNFSKEFEYAQDTIEGLSIKNIE